MDDYAVPQIARYISFTEFIFQGTGTSALRLPHASTCSLELFLPRGVSGAADLLDLLNRAVRESLGFQSDGDREDGCTEVMA